MVELPSFKELRRAYGFDEVALVPGDMTINPDQTSLEFKLADLTFQIPVLAAALDALVDPSFAVHMSNVDGLAVMNLEGIQTRYQKPEDAFQAILEAPAEKATEVIQRVYSAPIQPSLVGERVQAMKRAGARCAVSVTPANTKRLAPLAVEAGVDVLVVQSTVTTARHVSKSERGLIFSELVQQIKVPIVVGNCVTFSSTLEMMETGIAGILVGVGPGAICTSREVLGIGVPQATAVLDCAAAREEYLRRTGRYVPIIADGGIRTGGDLCKAIACGADAVMLGTALAQSQEAPGRGYSWGMSTHHPALPRGTRIKVGTRGTLKRILFGPTALSDGTENFMGALRVAMGMCGSFTIRDMHKSQVIIAPAIRTEGKFHQLTGLR
jgi:IMP dehydrogenase